MSPLAPGNAKLLPLEGKRSSDTNTARIPEEYLQLLLPYAGVHYWKHANVYVLSQHLQLGKFSLWVHDATAYRDQVICPFVPYPIYSLHYLFESSLSIRMPHAYPFQLEEDTCNLFLLRQGVSHLTLEAGTKAVSLHLNILPEHMSQLAKSHPTLLQKLSKISPGNRVINKHPYTINAVSNLLVAKILTCRYLRQEATLYLERCCTDLFNIFCRQHAIEDNSMYHDDVDTYDVYHRIFEYMKTRTNIYYDIHKISWMYEIPERELATGFLNTFAITLEECSHMLKMMKAFDLLMQQDRDFSEITAAVAMDTESMIASVEQYYNFKISVQRN
ncbi:hypothetical protein L3C95_00075 [Chitinophaga filiformis]|uniref:hypothetical protein n=1 Tax=Chitinophaga filiformis TaxID=104663 RepID=UPI001F3C7198|nr:hypothetical protein [Chitinophaga filiformis]MCF6401248.1 hypothetical protein [Chitinophaga filiformis]